MLDVSVANSARISEWPRKADLPNGQKRTSKAVRTTKWRDAVLEKGGYICVGCGEGDRGLLQGHHILAVSRFPELVNKVSNGEILCYKCHKKEKHGARTTVARY